MLKVDNLKMYAYLYNITAFNFARFEIFWNLREVRQKKQKVDMAPDKYKKNTIKADGGSTATKMLTG